MYNFPDHPAVGQTATVPNGAVFVWDGVKWGSTNAPGMFVPRLDTGKQTEVVNNGTANAAPVLTGLTTPQAAASDYFQIQPYNLGTPSTSGNFTDGPALALRGKTYPTTPNQLDLFAGNNALTYQRWQFQANGNLLAPGNISSNNGAITLDVNTSNNNREHVWGNWVDYVTPGGPRGWYNGTTNFSPLTLDQNGTLTLSCNTAINDPFLISVPNGHYARARYLVNGARLWSAGCDSSSRWAIADESGGTYRYSIDTGGNHTFTGNTYTTGVVYFSTGQVGDFYMNRSGNLRYLNWGSNWYDWWNDSSGVRGYTTPNGNMHTLDGGGNAWYNGNITGNGLYGNWIQSYGSSYSAGNNSADSFTARGLGVQYTRWVSNYVAWVWNGGGGNLQCYIDGNYVGFLFSDARVKTVVGDYEHGLAQIQQLNPIRYKLKGNTRALIPDGVEDREEKQKEALAAPSIYDPDLIQVGVMAQDAETVIPEMFSRGSAMIDGERADDVRLLDSGPWLVWALVNAVKELAARVEHLEGSNG